MYYENIYDVMANTGERINTLIIPNNSRLKKHAWEILNKAGLNLDDAIEVESDIMKLKDLTLILKRGEDIPQLVMGYADKGEVVLGVTADDLYDEFKLRVPKNSLKIENTYDWFDKKARYFRPALCLINKSGKMEDIPLEAKIALNSKYVLTSYNYIRKSDLTQGINFTEKIYNGGTELTIAKSINDCCIDIVYAGDTIDEKGLKEIDIIRFSDLDVISPLKKDQSLFGKVMDKEYGQVKARKLNPTDSYTSKLLADPEELAKKLNQESYELIQAFFSRGNLVEETADIMYAISMLLTSSGITLDEIAKEMAKRQNT